LEVHAKGQRRKGEGDGGASFRVWEREFAGNGVLKELPLFPSTF
jgi:hypothetical protein